MLDWLLDDPIPAREGTQLKLASESISSWLSLSIHGVIKFRLFLFLKFLHRFP